VTLRWVPQSLFGRLLGALLVAVGATLVVIVALLVQERGDRLFSASETAATMETIADTARSLAGKTADARAAEIEALRRTPIAPTTAAPTPRGGPTSADSLPQITRLLRTRLERALGDGYRVRVLPARPGPTEAIRIGRRAPERALRDAPDAPGPRGGEPPPFGGRGAEGGRGGPPFGLRQLDVAVTLPDGEAVAFRVDTPRAPPPLPAGLLLELAVVTVVLALALYGVARTVTRPLAGLAAAAEAVGRGGRFEPLPESGARELRDATRAFNTMQERLHRYLDSRTRVLAAMSHDLRTPLTRLKLRVETLEDPALAERFNADLDEMNRMVTGALNLFKGLNDDEPPQAVRLDALLEELRSDFAAMHADVTVQGAAVEPICVRRDALKRCLSNLLSNAVKYGGNATVSVAAGDNDVVVRVLDTGPGIPEEMLERVFEPFFRLEDSRSVDTGGVGLGLSIARDIAQALGGSLVVRNRTPHGLEAILRLPKDRH
jgi:signal transduction histidine kinase